MSARRGRGVGFFSTADRLFRPVDLKFQQLQAGEGMISVGRELCEPNPMPASICPPGSTEARYTSTRRKQPAQDERLPQPSPRWTELLSWLNREWDDLSGSAETPIVADSPAEL